MAEPIETFMVENGSVQPTQGAPIAAGGRFSRALSRLLRRLPWVGSTRDEGSAFAFGLRLFVTVALTFTLVGVGGFLLIEHGLAGKQIKTYAADQRTDARTYERYGRESAQLSHAITEIDQVLDAVARRPGTLEALLIGPDHVVRAAGDDRVVGETDFDPPINAALGRGLSYSGRESDPARSQRDFEFVAPVWLKGKRFAYEVSYDHRTYDAQLNDVRAILALSGLLALLVGALVFYLVGGRRLLRDHRQSLRRATRDGLTDLPNQRAFQDEFPQAAAAAARYGDSLALALLDVDDFKLINDRHGHPQGDAILRRVAEVLQQSRPGDRAYRIGGDEFALLLTHADADGARILARRVTRNLEGSGVELSIGVSVLRPGLSADTLRAEADTALYEAKRRGGNQTAHFEDIRGRVAVTTSEKKDAVRRLIDEGQITTVYQPIWDLDAGRLLGVEALTRPDPSYALSGPTEAFDVAEQLGLVHELDVLCVRSALRSAPDLQPDVHLFINLSPLTLDLDAEGNRWLSDEVHKAGLSIEHVVIEVTERFGGRTASVVKSLRGLREQGFKIAVDDVGTGNSGLEMLRTLQAEFVKIDRSIVNVAATEPGARAVLLAMATFARQTGAFVIAEGIEDEDTLSFLRGIDERDVLAGAIIQGGQGFRLGRPSAELSPQVPSVLGESRLTTKG